METQHREVIVNDPVDGVTQIHRTTENVADPAEVQDAMAEKKNQVIWYIVGLINAVLALRILFLLLGARDTGFATFLFNISDPFVSPFKGIFASPSASGSYFDSAALVAIVVYTLVGWALSALIDVVNRPARVS